MDTPHLSQDLYDTDHPEDFIESSNHYNFNNESESYLVNNDDIFQAPIFELDCLIDRARAIEPSYQPPPFSPKGIIDLLENNSNRISIEFQSAFLYRLRNTLQSSYPDNKTWQDLWYLLNYIQVNPNSIIARRMSGLDEADEWGFDRQTFNSALSLLRFLYQKYWRVTLTGVENLPSDSRALLVANHSGTIPWDGAILASMIYDRHPCHRLVRTLYHTGFGTLPFLSSFLVKLGQVLANEENVTRLLEQEQLVSVFPEGVKGLYKLYKDRYRLARFGRGGFVRIALKTQTPIIPVSIVGAEEIYISLAHIPFFDDIIGIPMIPISPTWPWLGLFGLIPLPTKWFIDIGKPIVVDAYETKAAHNPLVVSQLTELTRNTIQGMLQSRLEQRRSVFS